MEAGIVTIEDEKQTSVLVSPLAAQVLTTRLQEPTYFSSFGKLAQPVTFSEGTEWRSDVFKALPTYPLEKKVVSHRGMDIFEVLWSTQVMMSKELRKPIIEDITHVELSCQPIS